MSLKTSPKLLYNLNGNKKRGHCMSQELTVFQLNVHILLNACVIK